MGAPSLEPRAARVAHRESTREVEVPPRAPAHSGSPRGVGVHDGWAHLEVARSQCFDPPLIGDDPNHSSAVG